MKQSQANKLLDDIQEKMELLVLNYVGCYKCHCIARTSKELKKVCKCK